MIINAYVIFIIAITKECLIIIVVLTVKIIIINIKNTVIVFNCRVLVKCMDFVIDVFLNKTVL